MWFPLFAQKRRAASAPARRPSFRPRLEALEDRCVPSAGALDSTFGAGAGYVTTSLSSGNDSGLRTLLQPSGNIVVAGRTQTSSGVNAFGVVTYNPDGSLDAAFGAGGIVRQTFQATKTTAGYAILYDAALEPTTASADDKIILAGNDGAQVGLALLRLNANGSLDATFGSGGQVVTAFNKAGVARAVAVTSGGQIVAAGDNNVGNWYIARYTANGSLDPTFGSGGEVTSTFTAPGGGFNALVSAVAPQPDGKLVVVGSETWMTYVGSNYVRTGQGVVARYNANGSLDATFGNGGVVYTTLATGTPGTGTVTHDFGVTIYPNAGAPNDGKIVVVGNAGFISSTGTASYQPLVERYNSNGSLDTTFGNGAGYVTLGSPMSTGNNNAAAVAIQTDDKLIVANRGDMVARLNADGSLDTAFGAGGLVTTALGTGSPNGQPNTSFGGVAVQPNGDIVVGGQAYNGSKWNFAVARYLPSEPQIGSFTASANPVTAGSSETLTASNITDGNVGSTITQVTFYYIDSTGTKQVLGYGTQTSPGVWTLNFTVNLASGSYTLYAQAQDTYGALGDPFALSLQVN